MRLPVGLVTRWTAAVVLVVAAAGVAAALVPSAPDALGPSSRTDLLDTSVESVRVEQLQAALPDADARTALVVWSRTDGARLTDTDVAALTAVGSQLLALPDVVDDALAAAGTLPPLQPAPDGDVAVQVVPLAAVPGTGDAAEQAGADQVDALRTTLAADAPAGLEAGVTGGPAFQADVADVFDGADLRLLVATATVVALLLLVTYRSPLLVVVPLAVVGATEQTALAVTGQLLPRLDLPGGGQVTGIASVLVFGAATNYALLLIARYREQLRREPDHRAALRAALPPTAEAVVASGGTVVLALAVLLLTSTGTLRAIAVACIVGIVLAVVAGLVVLPAALVLLGRPAFWPFVPRVEDADVAGSRDGRLWGALGTRVAAAPRRVLLGAGALLALLALGLVGLQTGLSQNEQFRTPPPSVVAAERLAAALPAGAGDPVVVVTRPQDVDAVVTAAGQVGGVASAAPASASGDVATVGVVLDAEPGTEASRTTVLALRAAVDDVGDGSSLVGGGPAERVDEQDAQRDDRALVIPLVLLLVGLVLTALLRSVVAAVLLVTTVVASFVASLGASWLVFSRVLGFPAVDDFVLLIAFIFLVALGVDYNIFLTTRAREETRTRGTRAGVLRALRVTGGVITSAGVLLAAVFAVLGVLPLLALTQIGVIVCVGVLLDTLLVRTVVVPALVVLLGDRFWWPSRPAPRA